MMDETTDVEKVELLRDTINELKTQLSGMVKKKTEAQQKLEDIKSKLKLTRDEEHKTEERMKDILDVEAKFEELMSEENRLEREKVKAEDELNKIQKTLSDIKDLNKNP